MTNQIKLTERQMKNYNDKLKLTDALIDYVPGPCWNWQGSVSKQSGFGRFRAGNKVFLAHRVMYATTYGPIPNGHFIIQDCGNRLCCNPKHLSCVERAKRMPQGQAVKGSKLTPKAVKHIRERLAAPDAPRGTASSLARFYGVGVQSVLNVANYKSWKHIK